MKAYRCWHYLCRETETVVIAESSFSARREMAKVLGVATVDIVATPLETASIEIASNRTIA